MRHSPRRTRRWVRPSRYDWNGPAAAKELLRAVKLNPDACDGPVELCGLPEHADTSRRGLQEIRRAVDLDPFSIRTHMLGTILLPFTRRYDEAIDLLSRVWKLNHIPPSLLPFKVSGTQSKVGRCCRQSGTSCAAGNRLNDSGVAGVVVAVAGRKNKPKRCYGLETDENNISACMKLLRCMWSW